MRAIFLANETYNEKVLCKFDINGEKESEAFDDLLWLSLVYKKWYEKVKKEIETMEKLPDSIFNNDNVNVSTKLYPIKDSLVIGTLNVTIDFENSDNYGKNVL